MIQQNRTRSIPIELWCEMAREGAAPQVTICLEGDSMRPLIRRGCDPVTIIPLSHELRTGDVVLFTLGDGRYVVHRIWKLRDGYVRTLGDNCRYPEPWFPREQVLGYVARFSRNGRVHRLDTPAARIWGRLWMAAYPMRFFYGGCRRFAGRCARKLLGRGSHESA